MKRKAVFFDRDGTINKDKHYLYQIDEFEFIDGVIELLQYLKIKDYLLILITNQSGIARGYYSEESMHKLHEYMQTELEKMNAQFDAIYYCPHYPNGCIKKYAIKCECRKPNKLLFEKAIKEWDIDPQKSFAIGDKERDVTPARELGIYGIIIDENYDYSQNVQKIIEGLEKQD